jgi:cellulose synthase/poly-beta-1,6-N-acetylglucosamine synthase-like glycosyltransferase
MSVYHLLDAVLCLAGLLLALPCGYLLFLTLLSARLKPPAYGEPKLRFDFVVPSHNEELGIARTVQNLLAVDWPKEKFRVLVVADNCQDQTAARAREAGATVLERQDSVKRGKGYALDFAFNQSLAEGQADAVVVVDADTVVSKNLLQAFAARLEAGAKAAQAHYGVLEEKSSWRTRLMRIAFSVFHGVRSNARERLGVSCGLRGNGMCFSHALIREVPHDAFSVVEDVEYGIRIGKKGHRVFYAYEAEVLGEMVAGEKASRSQRRRWEGGRMALMRLHGWPLVGEALKRRSGLLMDLALDVVVPPLSWLVAPAMAGVFAAGVLSWLAGFAFWSGAVFAACLGALSLYVLRGWMLSGVGPRGLLDLAYAPIYVLWKIKLMVSKPEEKKGEWVRTTREAETAQQEGNAK